MPASGSGTDVRLLAGLVFLLVVFSWSAWQPHDRWTWFLEVVPVLVAIPLLIVTRRRYPLTGMVYALIVVHAVILMVGGHYTYARVPAGDWVADLLELERNHYDRLGHVAQGFVPAMIAREVLLRSSPLVPGAWTQFLVICVCLALSAFYELVEWWVAVATGEDATAFLGTQGDTWDTQWDMALALFGAVAALSLLSGPHDRALAALRGTGVAR